MVLGSLSVGAVVVIGEVFGALVPASSTGACDGDRFATIGGTCEVNLPGIILGTLLGVTVGESLG
jgi:hypothetical protein